MIESSGNKLMEASGDDGKAILYEDRIELVKKGGFITSVESTELIIDLDDIKNIDFIKISRVFSATKHVHFRNKGLRKYSKGKNKMGVSDGLIQIENSDHRFKELKKAALKQKRLNELKDSIFEDFEFEEEQSESIKEKIREAQNYIKEGEYDSAARVINKIQRIKRNKRKERVVKERLNDLREFIYKDNEIPEDGEKSYIEEFNKAQSYLEKNEPDSAEKAIKEAKNLKDKEIELNEELDDLKEYIYDDETQVDQKPPYIEKFHEAKKKIKEGDYKTAKNKIRGAKKLKKESKGVRVELNELERKIDLDSIGSNNKRKYEEIQTKMKKGEYRESENLIKKIFNDNGFKIFEGEWLKSEEIEEIKSAKIGLKNNFQSYDPYEFEEFVAKLFSEMGYEAEVTQKSADYGIDVIAEKPDRTVGVQVKQYSEDNPVGNKEVQNTLGSKYSVNADHTILVATSYFTDYAIKQAREAPIELWDKNKLHEMVKEHLMSIKSDSRTENSKKTSSNVNNRELIRSRIAGKITSIEADFGESVNIGDPVAIIENSSKNSRTILANADGVIKKVIVDEGDKINSNDPIFLLK